MRRAARADRNQPEIVAALRKAGATVALTHTIGKGFPDVAIGWKGRNLFFEIKDGLLVPSKQALTADELWWHEMWEGQVCVVNSVEQALQRLEEA